MRKPKGYWNDKQRCLDVAKLCETRTMFQKKYKGAYDNSVKNGWLDEFFEPLTTYTKGHWQIKENCLEVAKGCKNRYELEKKFKGAYHSAYVNGWLDEFFEPVDDYPHGYWNDKEKCLEVAKLCNGRDEFQKKYRSAYGSATRNGWLEECCSHMSYASAGYDPKKKGNFYIFKSKDLNGKTFHKIGITNRTCLERYCVKHHKDIEILLEISFDDGNIPKEIESMLKGKYNKKVPKKSYPFKTDGGFTEAFYDEIDLKLINPFI